MVDFAKPSESEESHDYADIAIVHISTRGNRAAASSFAPSLDDLTLPLRENIV
jgi:hypothetical protein